MIYYDYKFKTKEFQDNWNSILTDTFEKMKLHYVKSFSMRALLSHFKKSFGITPITIKNSIKDEHKRYRILAIYLLTKYSNEDFSLIANEFHMSLESVNEISSNKEHENNFKDDIKLFFKEFEDDFIMEQKSTLSFQEDMGNFLNLNLSSTIECPKIG